MDLDGRVSVSVSMNVSEKEPEGCSCGFHYDSAHSVACPSASFSLLFAVPPPLSSSAHSKSRDDDKSYDAYPSVDCTLSLRTPSTRQTMAPSTVNVSSSSSSCPPATSKFYWNHVLQGKQQQQATALGGGSPRNVGGRGSTSKVNVRPDPLLARRCANCDTTSTPLWRNGPRGPKSLCNACGIRYKKEERRAILTERNDQSNYANHGWRYASQIPNQPNSAAIAGDFRLLDNEHGHEMISGPCLSWRLNLSPDFPVGDMTSLVQDMT
ncbi:GATA transcription factor 18 [Nymphaea thermarum]|nr:GATA transcription factor 18 [Nymphaea thermarum]